MKHTLFALILLTLYCGLVVAQVSGVIGIDLSPINEEGTTTIIYGNCSIPFEEVSTDENGSYYTVFEQNNSNSSRNDYNMGDQNDYIGILGTLGLDKVLPIDSLNAYIGTELRPYPNAFIENLKVRNLTSWSPISICPTEGTHCLEIDESGNYITLDTEYSAIGMKFLGDVRLEDTWPNTDGVYDLGQNSWAWDWIYTDNIKVKDSLLGDGLIITDSTGIIDFDDENISTTGYYFGDGSQLTGINSGTDKLNLNGSNANQNIDIGSYDLETSGDMEASDLRLKDTVAPELTFLTYDSSIQDGQRLSSIYFTGQDSPGPRVGAEIRARANDGWGSSGVYDAPTALGFFVQTNNAVSAADALVIIDGDNQGVSIGLEDWSPGGLLALKGLDSSAQVLKASAAFGQFEDIVEIEDFYGSNYWVADAAGNIHIPRDDIKHYFGAADDKSIMANNSGMYFTTEVGSTPFIFDDDVNINGELTTSDLNNHNGTDLKIAKDGTNHVSFFEDITYEQADTQSPKISINDYYTATAEDGNPVNVEMYIDPQGRFTFGGGVWATQFAHDLYLQGVGDGLVMGSYGRFRIESNENQASASSTPMIYVNEVDSGHISSGAIIIGESTSYDFGHPFSYNPKIYMQSQNNTQDEWFSMEHNTSSAVFDSGKGGFIFKDNVHVTGNITSLGNVGIGTTPHAIHTLNVAGSVAVTSGFRSDSIMRYYTSTGSSAQGSAQRNMIVGEAYSGKTANSGELFFTNAVGKIRGEDALNFSTDNGDLVLNTNNGIIKVEGDLNVTGNITGNQIYGEAWGTDIGEVSLASAGVYYNITNLTVGNVNGFHLSGGGLIAEVSGMYSVRSQFAFSGQPNNEYHLALGVNGERVQSCHTERLIGSGGDVGSASITCFCPMEQGDNMTSMVENVDSSGNPTIHNINLNMVRIGD
jgi:hypothetical protein